MTKLSKLTVSEHIANLLENHECVIIPDFGGFLVKNSPASYSKERLEFYPPSAVTRFHIHLQNNDGLLIQSIMQKEEKTYSEAANKVAEFSKERKAQLKETKSTILPNIGKIYLDEEDKVLFKPNREANFNQESFGLPSITAEKIKHTEKVEQTVHREISKQKKRSPIALTFTVAASILALVLAGSLFFLHQGNQAQQKFVRASYTDIFKPFVNAESKTTTTVKPTKVVEKENVIAQPTAEETVITEEEVSPFVVANKTEPTINVAVTEQPIETTVTPAKADFHVVIGMFEKPENAQKRYEEALSKGYSNAILKHGSKYYRVVVPFSKETATWTQATDELKSTIEPDAWIWETLYQSY